MTIKIRPSDVLCFEACPHSYRLKKAGWRPLEISVNLVFGTAIHAVVEAVIRNKVSREKDVEAIFRKSLEKDVASTPIKFKKTFSEADAHKVGAGISKSFLKAWKDSGFIPVMTQSGEYLIERRMELEISPGVLLSTQLDTAVWTPEGNLAVIDFKTAAKASLTGFESKSDQLTAYQITLDAHADEFGLPPVNQLGFLEVLKRKTKFDWEIPRLSMRRSSDQCEQYIKKVRWMAEDIQRDRLPKRSLMAWNSPCRMCDFFDLCTYGEPTNVTNEVSIGQPVGQKSKNSDNWF